MELSPSLLSSLDEEDRRRVTVRRLLKEGKMEEAKAESAGLTDDEWEDLVLKVKKAKRVSHRDLQFSIQFVSFVRHGCCRRSAHRLTSPLRFF